MAYLDDLKSARDNFATELKAMSADPKPTYSVGGRSFSWVEYMRFLREAIRELNRDIAANEPFEIRTYGI